MQTVVQISEFFHDEQMLKTEQKNSLLQESMSIQKNDLESEIYSEQSTQDFLNREKFEFIISDSHFPFILIF